MPKTNEARGYYFAVVLVLTVGATLLASSACWGRKSGHSEAVCLDSGRRRSKAGTCCRGHEILRSSSDDLHFSSVSRRCWHMGCFNSLCPHRSSHCSRRPAMTRKSKFELSSLRQQYHCNLCGLAYKTLSRYDRICRGCATETETPRYRDLLIFSTNS